MAIEKSREILRLREKLGIDILWVFVLSILKNGPSHAYVLREAIEKRFGFKTGNVTVYVVLYKLEGRGFVKGLDEGNRRVYSITEKGLELLKLAEKEFREKEKQLFG